jgi:hypothetical protein
LGNIAIRSTFARWNIAHSGSNAFAYLQKILVNGEAIGRVLHAVFGQIIFDIAAGWWLANG